MINLEHIFKYKNLFLRLFVSVLILSSLFSCSIFKTEEDEEEVIQADTANATVTPVDKPAEPQNDNPPPPVNNNDNKEPTKSEVKETQSKAIEPSTVTLTGEQQSYTVKQGDTLMKIAYDLYGDIRLWKKIFELNRSHLEKANSLKNGMAIKYEKPTGTPQIDKNGDSYLIKMGDTLGLIARDLYATTQKWKKLYENNRSLIRNPNKIYAGFYLYYQMTEEEKTFAKNNRSTAVRNRSYAKNTTSSQLKSTKNSGLKALLEKKTTSDRSPASQ